MTTAVDERGRVLIPREFREAHGLTPGRAVIVEDAPNGVLLRPALSRKEALDRLAGSIRAPPSKRSVDPLALKRIWEKEP